MPISFCVDIVNTNYNNYTVCTPETIDYISYVQ